MDTQPRGFYNLRLYEIGGTPCNDCNISQTCLIILVENQHLSPFVNSSQLKIPSSDWFLLPIQILTKKNGQL